MLVATPGQTTAYTLHNNGNTTIPPAPTAAAAAAAAAAATTKKQTSVNISSSSSSGTPKCITTNNNKHNLSSTTTTTTATPSSVSSTGNSIKHHNNFNFHTPTHKTVTSSKDTSQHSLKNSDNSNPLSFISNLKDTVQKAIVNTATSLSRNCNKTTTTTTAAIKTNNSTSSSSNNNTSKSTIATSLSTSSHNVTSSSAATTKISSAAILNASSSTSTSLPLTVARKKCSQAVATQPKLHTIPPTTLHRYPEERQQASSTDSLQKEMCHFKPIRTVPTTPWKSGSKSRGSSLRFPKANLATTKTEFILKSNCDVNNRMKKKPQTKLTQNEPETGDDNVEGDDNDEQENKEYYERFKPKPSTLHLFTDLETPNHHSAFVCLVAQMKNLINIQSTKMLAAPTKGGNRMELHRTKSARTTRTKDFGDGKAAETVAALTPTLRKSIHVPVKDIFVRPKKFKSPAPPPAKRSDLASVNDVAATRSNRSAGKTLESIEVSKKIAKTNELAAKVTKAKSRGKVKGAKSKMINLVQLVKGKSQTSPTVDAGHPAAGLEDAQSTTQITTRKRKITPEIVMSKSMTTAASTTHTFVPPTPTLRSATARARKSARLSIEVVGAQSNQIFKYPDTNFSRAKQGTDSCFSPPLTRSRLKLLQQFEKGLVTPVVDVKKRKG